MWNSGRIFQVTVTEKNRCFFSPLKGCDPAKLTSLCQTDEFSGNTPADKIIFGATIGLKLPFFKQAHQIGIVEHQ